MWPFSRIAAWLEWRRRAREETLVGTCTYKTNWSDTGGETEHHVQFLIDGNSVRYVRIDSGPISYKQRAGEEHPAIRRDKFAWRTHGDLPDYVRRVDNRPRGKLVLLDGGAA